MLVRPFELFRQLRFFQCLQRVTLFNRRRPLFRKNIFFPPRSRQILVA
jgi:hypothetical protein